MGHSSSKQPCVNTKEELANRRDPSFCDKLLGRLHCENLAPYAREAIPITPITPKAQHRDVMGGILPRFIVSTYTPPKDLTSIPSTSHTQSQDITPEQSTHCASIYTPDAISRKDTMSPIDHSMHRCPQRAKPWPRPCSPFPATTSDTSVTTSHRTSTASTPPTSSTSKHLQEEANGDDDDDDDDEDYEDCYERSHEESDEEYDEDLGDELDEETEEVAKSADRNAGFNASLRKCSERLRKQTIGGTRISLHNSHGSDIHISEQRPLAKLPTPRPGTPVVIMNAIRKGKGKQKSSWPMETFETWRNVHGRPSSQKLSADVMATIETTSGKEGSIKSQDSRQAPSKRHADSLEAERTNKRRINNSQVQTRLQTYLRHEREKQEAADLAYATQLFEEERQRAEATQKSTPQPKECTVCGDVLPPLSFPAKPPTTTCTHTVNVCEACLQEWVSNQLSSNGWQGIHCPECPSTLSHPDMRLAASPATFVTYDTLSLRDTISTLQNFAWCLAPHCNFGQENTPHAQGAFMECTSCKYRQCLQHRCKWHDGETCDQYEYRVSGRKAKDEEVKNKKYLEKEAKQCPGMGCGAWIQKTSGCDHMTCRKCATEFCYLCRAPYASIRRMGNAAHAVDCRYHSDNLYPH